MVGAMARSAYTKNSKFLRGMTWKSFHNESLMSESKAVATAEMGTEEKIECLVDGHAGSWWVPHHRTGIYYPIGQEKVMEDVPIEAAKFAEVIHSFSSREDVHVLGGRGGMTWKSFHNESLMSESKAVATAEMGTEEKIECLVDGHARSWWVPHHRTGIYYPIGQERVMEDVPIEAAKLAEVIHSFSSREDVHVLGGRG